MVHFISWAYLGRNAKLTRDLELCLEGGRNCRTLVGVSFSMECLLWGVWRLSGWGVEEMGRNMGGAGVHGGREERQQNREEEREVGRVWFNSGHEYLWWKKEWRSSKIKTHQSVLVYGLAEHAIRLWLDRGNKSNSLFFPNAHSGDVSSINDVAILELLADVCPIISSWICGIYKKTQSLFTLPHGRSISKTWPKHTNSYWHQSQSCPARRGWVPSEAFFSEEQIEIQQLPSWYMRHCPETKSWMPSCPCRD